MKKSNKNNDKIYTYKCNCTKDEFLAKCMKLSRVTYYEYLFEQKNDNYRFGIAREGHIGGYWYIANIIEDDGLKISGTIKYIGPDKLEISTKDRILDAIQFLIIIIIFSPFIIIGFIFYGISRLFKLMKRKKVPKYTNEEKLNKLMFDILNCEQI